MNAVAKQVELTECQRQALEIAEGIAKHTGEINDAPNPINFDADAFFVGAVKQGMQQLGAQIEEFAAPNGRTEVQFTFHDGSAIHTLNRQCHAGEYHVR